MTGIAGLSLSLALLGPPAVGAEPRPTPNYEQRARRLFIASGVLGGLSLLGEATGAIISTTCELGSSCTVGFNYTWGSDEAGTRYSLITAGTGSAYVMARALSVPIVWTSEGLLLAGASARARADAPGAARPSKRLAWSLLGTGLGLYVASRLTRLGFALGGICQSTGCVYGFDQLTLGLSRGFASSGSALVLYRHTHGRTQLGLSPTASFGLALTGRF